MELKPGYKMTEVGVIPEDWECLPLGDCAAIFRGGSPRPIEAYLTTAKDGCNWIKIGDVQPAAKYITRTEEKIIKEGVARSRVVQKGDFLLSNSMSFGRPYILQIDGCIHDGWLVIQDYQQSFNTDFLYYLLCSEAIAKQYRIKAAGSGVLNLNKELVSSVTVFSPPSEEQTTIATALSDVDALLASLDALITKKRNMKQAAMQELLKDNENNRWRELPLETLCTLRRGYDLPARDRIQGTIPIFSSSGISGYHNQGKLGPGVIAGRYGTIGEIFYSNGDFWPLNTTLYVDNFHGNNEKFVYYFLQTIDWYKFNDKSAVPGINRNDIHNEIVRYPDIPEQTAIATVLSDMDAEIAALEARRAKTQALKQGMMQELLTGRIRLRPAEGESHA